MGTHRAQRPNDRGRFREANRALEAGTRNAAGPARSSTERAPSDTNYIFLTFVTQHLPAGLVGLVFAAIFGAAMTSLSAAPPGAGARGVLRRGAGTSRSPARLPRSHEGPCSRRALHGRPAAWPPGRHWACPRGGDALLLSLHRPSLWREERSSGGAREGQDPGGVRSARIRARSGRLPRRRPVHRRRPHRGLAPLPPGAAAGGPLASAAAGGIRALLRAPQGASRLSLGPGDVPPPPEAAPTPAAARLPVH